MSISPRRVFLVAALNAAAHYILLRLLRWPAGAPDLLLLYLVFLNLSFKGTTGLFLAFAFGLFQDFITGGPAGGYGIAYLAVAYLMNLVPARRLKQPGKGGMLAAACLGSFISTLVYRKITTPGWDEIIYSRIFLLAVYNGLAAIPAFPLYRRATRR